MKIRSDYFPFGTNSRLLNSGIAATNFVRKSVEHFTLKYMKRALVNSKFQNDVGSFTLNFICIFASLKSQINIPVSKVMHFTFHSDRFLRIKATVTFPARGIHN